MTDGWHFCDGGSTASTSFANPAITISRSLTDSVAAVRPLDVPAFIAVTIYAELGLGAAHWTDAQLIDRMLAHPILINRPVVVTPWGSGTCRPMHQGKVVGYSASTAPQLLPS